MNTIKIQIENENDLYNTFDPDEDHFTDDVKSYLLHHLDKADIARKITIRFLCAQKISEERIKRASDSWIKEEKEELKKKNRENMLHQLWMFGIGVAFLALSIVLQPIVNLIWFTILSTIGSLSLWEAASIWIIENPRALKHKKNIEKLEKNVRISVGSGNEIPVEIDRDGF